MVSAGTPTAAAPQAQDEGALPRWLLALERAHAQALRAARTLEATPSKVGDLAPVARPIEEAIAALYGAFDRRADPLAATRDAETALDRAVAALGPLAARDRVLADASAWLRDARKVLAVAEERFARVPPEVPEVEDLRASGDVPTLHRLERPSIVATIRLGPPPDPEPAAAPPPLPPPTTPAELTRRVAELAERADARRREAEARRAERRRKARAAAPEEPPDPPAGFARGRFTALSESQRVGARLRDCFEEVAMIGMQRAPLLGDPWRTALVLERRMLRAIDAIAALGPAALARIEPMVLDAPAKDSSRGFAAAMILGSFDGRDALGAAERVLRHLGPADPEVAASFAGALKLVPHPALPVALRTWLGDADGAVRAIAVDVLAYRGWITPGELFAAAADPSPVVIAAALPALGLSRPPDLAPLLEGALSHAEPAVREAAWTALALAGHPRAAEALEAEVFSSASPLASRAAVALAIVGEDREASRLIQAMRAAPTSALVVAAGWTGSPEAVPALIEVLRHKDAAIQLSAAYALDRITGARLYEEVLVPPEKIDVPEVEEPDVGEDEPAPLARVVSDPRDLPSEGAADVMTQPTVRVERWMAHWRDRGPSYEPTARYRRGRPYTPRVSLFELDALPLTPAERRLLQRELVVRTAQHVRFDPHDFVEVQVESLRAWAPIAEATSSTPGSWARPIRRS